MKWLTIVSTKVEKTGSFDEFLKHIGTTSDEFMSQVESAHGLCEDDETFFRRAVSRVGRLHHRILPNAVQCAPVATGVISKLLEDKSEVLATNGLTDVDLSAIRDAAVIYRSNAMRLASKGYCESQIH